MPLTLAITLARLLDPRGLRDRLRLLVRVVGGTGLAATWLGARATWLAPELRAARAAEHAERARRVDRQLVELELDWLAACVERRRPR